MPEQLVTWSFLDKNKNVAWTSGNQACFAGFPYMIWRKASDLPENFVLPEHEYLQYIPHKVNVDEEIAIEYLNFIKTIPTYKPILKGTGWKTFKEQGLVVSTEDGACNSFQLFALLTLLRNLYENPGIVTDWYHYQNVLTPVEALVAAHTLQVTKGNNGTGHALMDYNYSGPIEGITWDTFASKFPKDLEGVPLKKWAKLNYTPKEEYLSLHKTFSPGYDYKTISLLNIRDDVLKKIAPVKGEALREYARTHLAVQHQPLPIFDAF